MQDFHLTQGPRTAMHLDAVVRGLDRLRRRFSRIAKVEQIGLHPSQQIGPSLHDRILEILADLPRKLAQQIDELGALSTEGGEQGMADHAQGNRLAPSCAPRQRSRGIQSRPVLAAGRGHQPLHRNTRCQPGKQTQPYRRQGMKTKQDQMIRQTFPGRLGNGLVEALEGASAMHAIRDCERPPQLGLPARFFTRLPGQQPIRAINQRLVIAGGEPFRQMKPIQRFGGRAQVPGQRRICRNTTPVLQDLEHPKGQSATFECRIQIRHGQESPIQSRQKAAGQRSLHHGRDAVAIRQSQLEPLPHRLAGYHYGLYGEHPARPFRQIVGRDIEQIFQAIAKMQMQHGRDSSE